MITTCAAARCAMPAVAAFQWTDLRRGSRAEPVCAAHQAALRPFVGQRDTLTVNIKFITLREYAARLAREPTTVRVGPDDIAAAFADLSDALHRRR